MISIAMPVVKTRFCADAIASVLAQTRGDFELIVVDNQADGDLPAILSRFPDDRIRTIRHEQRLPVIENWNRCLSYAQREFFVLASDDDRYEPEFLAQLIDLTARYPQANLYHCRIAVIDEEGRILRYAPLCPSWESGLDFVWHRLRFLREQFVSNFMWRTEALRQAGGFVDFPGGWFADEATSFLQAAAGGAAYAPAPAFCYRQSALNLTTVAGIHTKLRAVNEYHAWMRNWLGTLANRAENQVLLADISYYLEKRVRHMKYRELLSGGLKGLPGAMRLLIGHRRQYGLGWRAFFWAALAAVAKRRFDPR